MLAELRRGRSHISFGRSWDSSQLSDEFRTSSVRRGGGEKEGKLLIEEETDCSNNNNQNKIENCFNVSENFKSEKWTEKTFKKEDNSKNSIELAQNQQQNQLNFLQQQKIISPKTSPKRAALPAENSIDAFNKIFNKQESKEAIQDENEDREENEGKEGKEGNECQKEDIGDIKHATSTMKIYNDEEKREERRLVEEDQVEEEKVIEREENGEKEDENLYRAVKLLDRINLRLDDQNEEEKEEMEEEEIQCEEMPKTTTTNGSPPLSDSSTVSSSELEREGILVFN